MNRTEVLDRAGGLMLLRNTELACIDNHIKLLESFNKLLSVENEVEESFSKVV